ncbi:hypothetical protein WA158_007841 [Blastocystis sp. Blastoise]
MSDPIDSQTKDQQVTFLFQDETRVNIPLSILKKYPKSLLSVTYEKPSNYKRDECAYCMDFPSLATDQLSQFIAGKVSMESMTIHDIIIIYKTIEFYFADEDTDFGINTYNYLWNQFLLFLKQTNCELDTYQPSTNHQLFITDFFTETRYQLFQKYSELFDFFNITYLFDVDIPYEYIYPSNLHELFPKLENYKILFEYYTEKKEIRVPPSDSHYTILYKEYKRLYYETNYPEAYEQYMDNQPDIDKINCLYDDEIRISTVNNQKETNNKNRKHKSSYKSKRINIDKEIAQEKQEDKPDLYVLSLSDYSREYNEKKRNEKIKDNNDEDKRKISLEFLYKDEEGKQDFIHPILDLSDNISNDVLTYILHLPICKYIKDLKTKITQSVKLQLNIPPLLMALKDGILDNLQILYIDTFVLSSSYPEYIQLFKDIISTHIFTNITTIKIDYIHDNHPSDSEKQDILLYKQILSLITKVNFPNLHIYDFQNYIQRIYLDETENKLQFLFPLSLLNIIDTIVFIDKKNENKPFFIFKEKVLNNILNTIKTHQITIKTNINIHLYNKLWKSLYDSGILDIYTLYFNFSDIVEYRDFDSSLYNSCEFTCEYLHLRMNTTYYNILNEIKEIFQNLNCSKLQTVLIELSNLKNMNIYLKEYFTLFSTLNYNTVKTLTINSTNWNDIAIKGTIDDDTKSLLYKFFSLFTNNITTLSISSNAIEMSHILNYIYKCIVDNKIPKLKSLTILYYNNFSQNDYLTPLYTFIESFKTSSSISLPFLNKFYIHIINDHNWINIYNVFELFPSFSYYLYKHIDSVVMIITDDSFMNNIMNLLSSKTFPYLKYITMKFKFEVESSSYQSDIDKLIAQKQYTIRIE